MANKREKNGSRRGNVHTGCRAREVCRGRSELCGAAGEMNVEEEDVVPESGGVFVVGGMPEAGKERGVMPGVDGGGRVLEVFRRDVPERELKRWQRLPKVDAFGDFLRVLGTFTGKGCLSCQEKLGGGKGLEVFRELEKLVALFAPKADGCELVFPAGRVCLRRERGGEQPEEPGACERIVIDLSDLFK